MAHCWSVFILLFFLYVFTVFFTVLPSWNDESKDVVVFSISEERQLNVNHIYSNKNSEMTSGCRKWKNRFKTEKSVVLSEYFEQQTDYHKYNRKIRKLRRDPLWRGSQPYLFTFHYQTNWNHATELSTVGHVISQNGTWKVLLISLKL